MALESQEPSEFNGPTITTPSGARHIPRYLDKHEEYVPVSRPLLRELSTLALLQEGVGAAGAFFFSGPFWLIINILVEHSTDLKTYAPWLILCCISMLFGAVLIWIGYNHFRLKQRRIEDIFSEEHFQEHIT